MVDSDSDCIEKCENECRLEKLKADKAKRKADKAKRIADEEKKKFNAGDDNSTLLNEIHMYQGGKRRSKKKSSKRKSKRKSSKKGRKSRRKRRTRK